MARYYDYYEDGDYRCSGIIDELVEQTGMNEMELRRIMIDERELPHKEQKSICYVGDTVSVYAYYKRGQFVKSGTLDELEVYLNIKRSTLMLYGTPSYMKRTNGKTSLLKIEGEFDVVRKPDADYDKEPIAVIQEREKLEELKNNETVTIKRRISPKPFSFKNDWINYQLENMFRGWNSKKDVEKA